MQFIIGPFAMVIGATLVIYTEQYLSAFGRIPLFENYLGSEGGSRLGYKLVGLLFFFFGLLGLVGLLDNFVLWALEPLIAPMKRL